MKQLDIFQTANWYDKHCPFCSNKLTAHVGRYICEPCGAQLSTKVIVQDVRIDKNANTVLVAPISDRIWRNATEYKLYKGTT